MATNASRMSKTTAAAVADEAAAAAGTAPEGAGLHAGTPSPPAPAVIREDVNPYDVPTAFDVSMVDVTAPDTRAEALGALLQPPPIIESDINPPRPRRALPARTGVIHTWPDDDDDPNRYPVDNDPAARPGTSTYLVHADIYNRAYQLTPDKPPVTRTARRGDLVRVSSNHKTDQHVSLGHLIPWDPDDPTAGLI